jgi:hypothetical protein
VRSGPPTRPSLLVLPFAATTESSMSRRSAAFSCSSRPHRLAVGCSRLAALRFSTTPTDEIVASSRRAPVGDHRCLADSSRPGVRARFDRRAIVRFVGRGWLLRLSGYGDAITVCRQVA